MEDTSNLNNPGWEDKIILIVEDEPYNLDFILESIKETKVKYIIATDGKTAIDIFNNTPNICLVLLDIRLPDISGYEVARELKNTNKDLIIIAQTAYAGENERKECKEAGCSDFITKPIQKQTILKLIKRYIKAN